MDFGAHDKLVEARAMKGDLVLVLGAGANAGSQNRLKHPIPAGTALAKILCHEMGEAYSGEPLADVASAFEHLLGRDGLNKVLIREFRFTTPSDDLRKLFNYTWKRVFTWNYDDATQIASANAVQRIETYNGMIDSVEDLSDLSVLQIIYLHGKISQLDNGLILTEQDYADVLQKGNHSWYRKAIQDYRSSTVLFIGSSLSEPILSAEVERAARSGIGGNGISFLITPDDISGVRRSSLEKRGIIHVKGTLAELAAWLERRLGSRRPPTDVVSTGRFFNQTNIGRFSFDDVAAAQNIRPVDPNSLMSAFENEPATRRALMGRTFLNGFPPTWMLAASPIPVKLKQLSDLHASLKDAGKAGTELFVTVGQAGSGKSTATMQALVELAREQEFDVFELSSETRSVAKALSVLKRISDKQKLVYIPTLFVFGTMLADEFDAAREAKVTFVSTARSSEWKEHFEKNFGRHSRVFAFQRFVKDDHAPLIERLKGYVPSPGFVKLRPEQQVERLSKSKNQLLIALREATESRNFDDIIINEFQSLVSDDVRELFVIVGISTLARVGIPPAVAAEAYGAKSRQMPFDEALARLEGIVAPVSSGRLLARHEFYVRNILDQVVPLSVTLESICFMLSTFTKYEIPITRHVTRPDAALFRFLLNHSFIRERSERGGDKFAGLDIYRHFEVRFQLDGHFWLQYGLYYQRLGNPHLAIEMLEKSISAFPDNAFAIHALASERLVQAGKRAIYDKETRRLISDGVRELEKLNSNPLLALDQYPLVTLSTRHVPALLAHKQSQSAIDAAKDYYERLRYLEKKMSSPEIAKAKAKLLKFVTTRIWET